MKEEWKDIYFEEKGIIRDYKGLYQVSNLGRVKSLNYKRTGKEKILKPLKDTGGYLFVSLFKNGKRKYLAIHRLVAFMFIPNPENKPHINHKSGIKTKNSKENLEWCTNSENQKHAWDIGLRKVGEKQKEFIKNRGKERRKKVNQYDLQGNFIKTWDSIIDVERKLEIKNQTIVACCKRKRKKAGGFIWRYAEDKKKNTSLDKEDS